MDDQQDGHAAAAQRAVTASTDIMAALLVAAVKQVQAEPGSLGHAEYTREMQALSEQLLNVKNLTPPTATFAVARGAAALLTALSKRVGVDPAVLVEGFEWNTFLERLPEIS